MRKNILLSLLASLVMPFFAGNASADSVVYPAAMCVRWTSGDPIPSLSSSRVFNNSAAWMRLDCPVLRNDFDGFLHTSAVEESWISFVDQHQVSDACASLTKYLHVGLTESWGTGSNGTQCSTSYGYFSQRKNTGSMYLGDSSYHMYMSVWVPPQYNGNSSGVVSYYVSQ